ncbi:MAG: hypothetical protein WBJ13_04990 [Sedimentibacter sp.]
MSNMIKVLCAVAIIGLIIFVLYLILPDGWYLKLNPIKDEHMKISVDYENISQNFEMENTYEKRKIELLNEIDNLNMETKILQEKIIYILYEYCLKNDIEINNITFSEIMPASLTNDIPDENYDTYEQVDYETAAVFICVSLEFTSSYEDMLNLVDDIKNDHMDIAVTNMRTVSLDGDVVYGVIDLNFYAIPIVKRR